MRVAHREIEEFLARTRRHVDTMNAQIQVFAERVRVYSHSVAEPAPVREAGARSLVDELRERNEALVAAVEELRVQRDALAEAQRHLERERSKYVDLFENAPVAFVTTDARGIIQEGNAAAAEMLGVPPAVLPGKLLIAFVARGDVRAFRDRLSELTATGVVAFEGKLRPSGRSPFQAALLSRPIRTPGGAVVAHRWTIRHAGPRPAPPADVPELIEAAIEELRAPVTTVVGWSKLLRDGVLDEVEREGALAAVAETRL